jgi:outer membrane protein
MHAVCCARRVAFAVAVAWCGVAAAQEGPVTLTLPDAVTRAEQNSHRLAELQARVDVAAAVQAGRDAAGRPVLAVLGGYMRTNHVDEFRLVPLPGAPSRILYPDVPDNYRARLDLQWPIYTAGRVDALAQAAGAEREAATSDVAAARLDLRLETTRAFWALVTARQTEAVVARALDALDAHVLDLQSRLQQGLIPPNDVQTAEAQRSRERLLAIEATNLRRVAEADLRRLIGADSFFAIEPVVAVEPPSAAIPAAADALAEARRQRPELRAFASRTEAAHARERAAAAAAKPQLAVAAGYDYARPNPRIFPRVDQWHESWDASINVSWSLWDGGRRHAEEAEARATTRTIMARASGFDRQLAFEIEQRSLEMASASAAIPTADEGIRAAAEARRVVGERYTAGVATNTDVLDAQTALLQAELDRTRAIANARLAAARLERAMGR